MTPTKNDEQQISISDTPVKSDDGFGFAFVEQAEHENDDNNYYDDDRDNDKDQNRSNKGKGGGFFHKVQLIRSHLLMTLRKRLHRYPCLSRIIVGWISLIPPRFFILFLIWKVYVLLFCLHTAAHFIIPKKSTSASLSTSSSSALSSLSTHQHITPPQPKYDYAAFQNLMNQQHSNHNSINHFPINLNKAAPPSPHMRILHIVTALAEYNNGLRGTVRGQDRLQEVLIPLLSEGVTSMVEANWHVDVYLICGFELSPERKQLVIDALPNGVGLQVWNDATPLGYDRNDFQTIQPITRALARQHRLVIADKLDQYDFFSVWEDDMRITSKQIEHYLNISNELDRLKQEASSKQVSVSEKSITGPMSYEQLERVFPGFIRVEVLKPDSKVQRNLDPIPVDLNFSENEIPDFHSIDPEPCCFIPSTASQKLKSHLPPHPNSEDIMIWETAVEGYSVRQFPQPSSIGWVALQPGPGQNDNSFVHGYWAGDSGIYKNDKTKPQTKPSPGNPRLFGQQGGFMATRKQIDLFQKLCENEFLPPFHKFKDDGLYMMNLEYWSGGQQLWGHGKGACNLQRILLLEPDMFSKHLLYHTANNKQNTIDRERLVKANNLLGQLNSVKKAAMA